ncbi:Fructose-bisphosphate aldolase class I [Chitinispirillum alkaliphilum]|nr:Fructose-bisphosphate aldolase class I [Chitinispirillum alkaliphilum]
MYLETDTLLTTAQAMMMQGKGILAADESMGTIGKRFQKVNLDSTPKLRQAYREMLFTAPGIEQYISSVILFDETIRQRSSKGVPFPVLLRERGIIPGIKVDRGTSEIPFSPEEKVTEGLDGLRERLLEYRELGAQFCKWRAVFSISCDTPTDICISSNVHALARYAALCQEVNLVPMIEPEVLMDGDHDIETCARVTLRVNNLLFKELLDHKVKLEGAILKPNMVLPGKESERRADVSEIAQSTVRCFNRTVPPAVCGIAFLSGGQSPFEATENLNAINKSGSYPWRLTFSFSRALQQHPLEIWRGKEEKVKEAQAAFVHRARCNSAASTGNYTKELEEHFE